MFMGEFEHSIDTKGRLIIPAKFRSQLGEEFVITRGMDGCLFGYPMAQWEIMQKRLSALPLNKRDARAFVRFFYSAATTCSFDKQGRVNLPQTLIKHAELAKQCVIVGVSDRFEIWSQERWQAFADKAEENFDDIAENLIDFDL
ncbi:MAG TPA: transcriptional regulator MraZ [Lactobacillus sp.]|uniref:Transcriptional regulator MraZ n=1 Tax=Secundilactobacillus silagincola TaxID=1714681 RepID=A0A1Z5J322_9LACO|nr:division/cell wall cluster transcriptional repressor MraZ [Secundilactobacillus silagincola]GAX08443.1 cell division protein MraZ [Secundilactobacillus silagincola]HBF73762.1 transcriptional regulator MraZ [Lactobacillus sp.]